jgi:NADPH-dependent 7-cyano-7-deazaguanine reductase QueF
MLIKDTIKVTRLNHITANSLINVALAFDFNNSQAKLSFKYIPDKYKIEQDSLKQYLQELKNSQSFNLEELTARLTEDLYDMAVPKQIDVNVEQIVDDITTSIQTSKAQPNFKK